jgi:hypothetical protein
MTRKIKLLRVLGMEELWIRMVRCARRNLGNQGKRMLSFRTQLQRVRADRRKGIASMTSIAIPRGRARMESHSLILMIQAGRKATITNLDERQGTVLEKVVVKPRSLSSQEVEVGLL